MAPEQEGRLDDVVEHGGDTRSLFVRLAAPLVFRPGQFVSCLLPIGGETMIRPYSIASDPEDATRLELLLNRVPDGPGSTYLFERRVGDALRFTGPWGTFTLDRAPAAEAVFIADGTGIAPIRPMVHRARATAAGQPLRLLHALEPGAPAVYRDELRAALPVEYVGRATLEDEVRRRWVDADGDRSRHFFICGIGPLVPALRDLLRRAGYERRAVQYEKW
jgi:ferredoxin-NADP reductase